MSMMTTPGALSKLGRMQCSRHPQGTPLQETHRRLKPCRPATRIIRGAALRRTGGTPRAAKSFVISIVGLQVLSAQVLTRGCRSALLEATGNTGVSNHRPRYFRAIPGFHQSRLTHCNNYVIDCFCHSDMLQL
jgi:hypothetical protein